MLVQCRRAGLLEFTFRVCFFEKRLKRIVVRHHRLALLICRLFELFYLLHQGSVRLL